jgi:hypothetical protein
MENQQGPASNPDGNATSIDLAPAPTETAQNPTEKTFPTAPDEEGFFTESEYDDVLDIRTKVYENGNKVKKVPLSGGRTALVRELIGRDSRKAKDLVSTYARRNGKEDEEDYADAVAALATKVDGQDIIFEDFLGYKMMDYTRIKVAAQSLNFQ